MIGKYFPKVGPNFFILLCGICIAGFGAFHLYLQNELSHYISVRFNEEIPLTELKGSEKYGGNQWWLFYEKNRYIPKTKLVKTDCSDSVLTKLKINAKTLKKADSTDVELRKLPKPFKLFKLKNSDTVVAIKDSCRLMYLIVWEKKE